MICLARHDDVFAWGQFARSVGSKCIGDLKINFSDGRVLEATGSLKGLLSPRQDWITGFTESYLCVELRVPLEESIFLFSTGDREWAGECNIEVSEYFHASDVEVIDIVRRHSAASDHFLTFRDLVGKVVHVARDGSNCCLMVFDGIYWYSTSCNRSSSAYDWEWMQQLRVPINSKVELSTVIDSLSRFMSGSNPLDDCKLVRLTSSSISSVSDHN